MSLLSPAPEAAEPYVTDAPGNLLSTDWSMPDSFAEGELVLGKTVRGMGGRVPESEVEPVPFFRASEFRSRSACFARSRGFVFLYSADMVG